ncbi:MAG: HEAT repeat domain-containing protein [Deltaproteobacteria bacterium]|nr:HEAT repeat domain-containing protein [Deltaproteobacteria bacterium]
MQLGTMGRFALALLVALLFSLLISAAAWAHGGRFNGPGGRGMPGDPSAPSAPAPKRGKPPVTPGAGIPSTRGAMPDVYWGTWWALNRWAYLPERGEIMRKRKIITGAGEPALREQLDHERRALLARQNIKPFLLDLLDPKSKQRDSVTAAAMIALAKISCTQETLERLLDTAEDKQATLLERESAALAVGLLRRTDPKQRMDPISLDLARTRLLAILKDLKQDIRARCFAAFSLGLLADQGYGSPFSKDGRLVVRGLLQHLAGRHIAPDLPIALMTALALQPRAGVPSSLFEDLRRATTSGNLYRRKWSAIERAHALSTYARLEGPNWVPLMLRSLSDRRLPKPVQRTARLVLGGQALKLSPEQRLHAAEALIESEKKAPGALSRGLAQIALARILNADLHAGCTTILDKTHAARLLQEGATKSLITVRGFHVLALALAARGVESHDEAIQKFVDAAKKRMLAGFDRPRGDNDLKGAYVIGIGMLKVKAAEDRLVGVLGERNAGPSLRARAAIALVGIEAADDPVLEALRAVIADERPLAPRSAAALALSLITGVPASDMLVKQLRAAESQRAQVQAAAALGQLDDPAALPAIIEVAREHKNNYEMRAIATAILGMLGDPEEHPSLFRLSLDANYIARTDALNEAFTML